MFRLRSLLLSSSQVGVACLVVGAAASAIVACGDNKDRPPASDAADLPTPDAEIVDAAVPDAFVDPTPDADLPAMTLRESGLYSDFDARTIADGVLEYEPAWPLWTDGALKRRWIQLPPGSTIDTSNMDFWNMPEGTKLWKEFATEDKVIETRYMEKRGPNLIDWYYVSFAWNEAQDAAVAAPDGIANHLDTTFDVPEERDCRKCHQRQPDFVLGFSAIQLAHEGQGVTLQTLVDGNLLSDNPPGESPYFPVPGTGVEQASIGYLHGNCGGCHHEFSDVMDNTAINLRLRVDELGTVEGTTVYATSVGVANQLSMTDVTALIEPGDPNASAVFRRMQLRGDTKQMPIVGTEIVDQLALDDLQAWIESLPVAQP